MDTEKIFRNVLIGFTILAVVRYVFLSGWVKTNQYTGDGYSIIYPKDWMVKRKKDLIKGQPDPDKTSDFVIFECPDKNPKTEKPNATISIYTKRLDGAYWLDDEFPAILKNIAQSGVRIVDKGENKIDSQIARWVLFDDKENDMLVLRFYLIDMTNRLIQVEYATQFDKFQKYRDIFEAAKKTIDIQAMAF